MMAPADAGLHELSDAMMRRRGVAAALTCDVHGHAGPQCSIRI
jgi:hypothetical protein